ncbi:MAG: YafY family transcriptional regulator [candidate division Zixibacteria bacterium]|nr:YafY family transcriptional regulator [candidate division Zixibacteria bacterium]
MGMPKYDRLLHILNLLRSRKNLNATSLAKECGVTERSIYRDILALSEANVPIYYDNGYKLASSNFLPPLNFDLDEYQCLRLALESSPLKQTDKYSKLINLIAAKVEAGLPEAVRMEKKFSPPTTHVSIATSVAQDQEEAFFETIEGAISRYRCLDMNYEGISSGTTHRIVEPYFMIFRGRAFYFVAYCRLRDDFRTFRVDRITDLTVTDDEFKLRTNVNAETYFDGSWELYSGEPVEVVARLTGAAARVVLTSTHHPDEIVEKTDEGKVIYRVVTRGIEEIQRWLLGFGSEVEVLEPQELRDSMRQVGEELVKSYAADRQR